MIDLRTEYDMNDIDRTLRDTEDGLEELESIVTDLWKKGRGLRISEDLRLVMTDLSNLRHSTRQTRKRIHREVLEIPGDSA